MRSAQLLAPSLPRVSVAVEESSNSGTVTETSEWTLTVEEEGEEEEEVLCEVGEVRWWALVLEMVASSSVLEGAAVCLEALLETVPLLTDTASDTDGVLVRVELSQLPVTAADGVLVRVELSEPPAVAGLGSWLDGPLA